MIKTVFLVLGCAACALAAPSKNGNRIVGGQPADPGQFKYQVSLRINGQHFCGGSIISPSKILTAAHCVHENNQPITVVAGVTKLDEQGQELAVAKTIVHPSYSPSILADDLAVLILAGYLEYNDNVQRVVLRGDNVSDGDKLILSGWGLTYPGSAIPNHLQWIQLESLNLGSCARALQGAYPIYDTSLCTTSPEGEGVCQGDSGGPLVDDYDLQVGIVSWGVACAKGFPDVFTAVASYAKWIITQ